MALKLRAIAFLFLIGCGTTYAVRHKVAQGEDVSLLAGRSGISEAEFRKMNHLGPNDKLRPGDTVFVPGAPPSAARTRAVPRGTEPPAAQPSRPAPSPSPPPRAAPTTPAAPAVPSAPAPPAKPAPAPPAPKTAARSPAPLPEPGEKRDALAWPVAGEILRSFGKGPAGENLGIDIGVPVGTSVRAAAAGRVIYAGTPTQAYGPLVIVDHGARLHTVYSNLKEVSAKRGDTVSLGQALGTSGEKAVAPLPHLHFEVRRNGDAVDPLLYLPPR